MDNNNITINQLQSIVDEWITTIGAGYFSPLTNTAVLAEETGEVAKVMARVYGDQKKKDGEILNLGDELADVLWVVAAIANQTGINLTEAVVNNIAKKNVRDKNRFINTHNNKNINN